MSDKIDKSSEESKATSETKQPVSSVRRKLVIGSVPVMASLMSRPLWAGGSELGRCTISGALSGPSSSHEEELCQGLTPGYWKNHDWPAYVQGTCTSNGNGQGGGNCTWQNDGTTFISIFPLCAAQLASVYPILDPDNLDITWANASLMTILQLNKSGNSTSTAPALQLAFHVVAGLLNSASLNINYGYTADQFIILVENYCTTGQVPGLGAISIGQFKDLLDHRNNGDFDWMPI